MKLGQLAAKLDDQRLKLLIARPLLADSRSVHACKIPCKTTKSCSATPCLPPRSSADLNSYYNLKAAASTGSLCLDKKLVYDGGPDKMEICDLLTRHGGLIHVKHRGSSSTLSHLFAQGVNSAERLLQDPEFRRQSREIVSREDPSFANVLPADRPVPEEHEITFAVITRSDRPTTLTLPFFSRVSLRTAARRLHTLGFRVSVATVREPTSIASRPE